MSFLAASGQQHGHGQEMQNTPPPPRDVGDNGDGITVKPMTLKVLYTFDDKNITNCLARWPHVLQLQTIVMEEGGTIGVIELRTCIEAIIQCSPELDNRMGQDYTVYAYDYSEYDNPLVGQGMLSRVLQSISPVPDVPARESRQLVTGRVCNNIRALFNNGVKETLEVKLKLVPVPTSMQSEYQITMEQYREANRSVPPAGYDHNEWNSLIQSTPNFAQASARTSLPPKPYQNQSLPQNPHQHRHPHPSHHQHSQFKPHSNSHHHSVPQSSLNPRQHDGRSVEAPNPILSPIPQEQRPQTNLQSIVPVNALPRVPSPQIAPPNLTKGGKVKKPSSRPASRTGTKRPRKLKAPPAVGGNTSGYEECTDGDDGPAPKKRAKITKATEWNQRNSFGNGPDSLRVAASTAGSLRLFRPIAMNQNGQPSSHVQDIPRAPTPVPRLPQNMLHQPGQSGLRRDSLAQESTDHASRVNSPHPSMSQHDGLRDSIESAGPSPGRQDSPVDSLTAETPVEFNSSPPVMRTRPPSLRSSPPCPISPCLPPMPRTDSGFMSGSMEELFGDNNEEICSIDDEDEVDMVNAPEKSVSRQPSVTRTAPVQQVFLAECPGPVGALPTRMPVLPPAKESKAKTTKSKPASQVARSRGGSVLSEDGTQTLPPLRTGNQQLPSGLSVQQSQSARGLSQESTGNSPHPHQPGIQGSSVSPYETTRELPQNMSQAPNPSPFYTVMQQLSSPQPSPIPIPFSQPEQSAHPRPQTPQPSSTVNQGSQSFQFPPPQSQVPRPVSPQQSKDLPEQSFHVGKDQGKNQAPGPQTEAQTGAVVIAPPPAPRRMMNRTASVGVLTFPPIPASDPTLPPSSLQRSQTWSEVPHAMTEGPMPMMDDTQQAGQGLASRKDRSWNAKKAAIKQKLEQAIANGEMPPFCANCGSIETPTWRKSWSRECQGAPGYYEYSDEPGRVTSVVVLARDLEGTPTSFLIVKKSLSQEDDLAEYKEFTLCNPCGIWMSKYKSQRPPEKWEGNNIPVVKKVLEKKQPKPRVRGPRNKMAGSEPPVEFNVQAPTDGLSPTDVANMQQRDTSQEPSKRLNAMTSDAASAALRRAIQSSPARWVGTRHSPISLEVDEPSRRLLFPSPRKVGSPKVLGDTITNVVQFPENYDKDQVEVPDKENCPPITLGQEDDAEFLKMFEDEMARPTTPVQKEIPENLFKTPNRPTPRTRGANGSASKSGQKSSDDMLHLTPIRTPRRSPRNHNTEMPRRSPRNIEQEFMSPFTASLNRIMSATSDQVQSSPARHGMGIDFENLPDLPLQNHNNNFNLEDFFSTDVIMPSSPPRAFRLYEDPISLNNINWDEFNNYNEMNLGADAHEEEVTIKDEPQESPQKGLENEISEQESA